MTAGSLVPTFARHPDGCPPARSPIPQQFVNRSPRPSTVWRFSTENQSIRRNPRVKGSVSLSRKAEILFDLSWVKPAVAAGHRGTAGIPQSQGRGPLSCFQCWPGTACIPPKTPKLENMEIAEQADEQVRKFSAEKAGATARKLKPIRREGNSSRSSSSRCFNPALATSGECAIRPCRVRGQTAVDRSLHRSERLRRT